MYLVTALEHNAAAVEVCSSYKEPDWAKRALLVMRDDLWARTLHTVPHGKCSVDVSETAFLRKWTLKGHRARGGGSCRLLCGSFEKPHSVSAFVGRAQGVKDVAAVSGSSGSRLAFYPVKQLKQVKCELLNQPGDSWVAVFFSLCVTTRHCKKIYDLHLKCCTDSTEASSNSYLPLLNFTFFLRVWMRGWANKSRVFFIRADFNQLVVVWRCTETVVEVK